MTSSHSVNGPLISPTKPAVWPMWYTWTKSDDPFFLSSLGLYLVYLVASRYIPVLLYQYSTMFQHSVQRGPPLYTWDNYKTLRSESNLAICWKKATEKGLSLLVSPKLSRKWREGNCTVLVYHVSSSSEFCLISFPVPLLRTTVLFVRTHFLLAFTSFTGTVSSILVFSLHPLSHSRTPGPLGV